MSQSPYSSTPSLSIQRAAYLSSTQGSSFGGSPGSATQGAALSPSLRPLSVKQLLQATRPHDDALFVVEGNEIGQVTVVAQVVGIQRHTTNDVFILDDTTAKIEARRYVDGEEIEEYEDISENNWVRIIGKLRRPRATGKSFISTLHIRPVKNPHEIFFHLAEVMVAQVAFDRNNPIAVDPTPIPTPTPTPIPTPTPAALPAERTRQHGTPNCYAHLPPVARGVVDFLLSQPDSDKGTPLLTITLAVDGTTDAIVAALRQLEDEGIVYEADELRFKGHWCGVEQIIIEDVFAGAKSMLDAGQPAMTTTYVERPSLEAARMQAAPLPVVHRTAAPLAPSSSASSDDFRWSPASESPPSPAPSFSADPWRYLSSTSSLLSTYSHHQVTNARPPRRTPLAAFFARFPAYRYNPSESPSDEFRRLSQRSQWQRGSQQSTQAWEDYRTALVEEFDDIYGTDVNDINSWHLLCAALRIYPLPEGLMACRMIVHATHVNLVDLVQARGKTAVKKFRTVADLSDYTQDTGRFFPREVAKAGGVLKFLLRHIFDPEDDDY